MLDRMLLTAGGEEKLYVEDVFNTWVATGTGGNLTVNNGIDLSGKGGLVWSKARNVTDDGHRFNDTARGISKQLLSNSTAAQVDGYVITPTSTGFVDNRGWGTDVNMALWTFRKAPKFFDVVTYTGNGIPANENRSIAHSLGVAPGSVFIKCTNNAANWAVWHRSLGVNEYLELNNAEAKQTYAGYGPSSGAMNATTIDVGPYLNQEGYTYVAYLFAHDATADGIIQCGSYMGNSSASGPTISLGWEPQWLMIKRASGIGNWQIIDNMRGMPVGSADATLQANLSNAESTVDYVSPTATGFQVTSPSSGVNTAGSTYTYLAIRRGPMKTPTVGTSVFSPYAATGYATAIPTGFPSDMEIQANRVGGSTWSPEWVQRLTASNYLTSSSTAAETSATGVGWDSNTSVLRTTVADRMYWNFRRAPGFFDVVCYTPAAVTGTAVKHNLGVVPELVISRSRTASTGPWLVSAPALGDGQRMRLNGTDASAAQFATGKPATSTEVYENHQVGNFPAAPWVAYLFASVPGVSKVGTYTGNGSSQTINCGFSSGARFFLVKRTDSTGDWWVYDSARGIVAAADPALTLNTTNAEVTSADAVDTASTGIIVNQEATCNINVNGATYIYLAIA